VGVELGSFNVDDLKVEYAWAPNLPPQAADPSAGKKKEDKKPAKDDKKGKA
jgi:hypothetical protein